MPIRRLLRPLYAPPLRRYRRWTSLRVEQRRIRDEVRLARRQGRAVNIVIGAGSTRYPGWIATDIPAFNALIPAHWARLFPRASIDRMLAEHVFEHLTEAQLGDFLALARGYLAAGGRIRIAVPDGNHPDPAYIDAVRPGGSGTGATDHKVLYTQARISEVVAAQGYRIDLQEYFNAGGIFHRQHWSAADGFVMRSAAHDRRNTDGQLRYTSLIVDCWLP